MLPLSNRSIPSRRWIYRISLSLSLLLLPYYLYRSGFIISGVEKVPNEPLNNHVSTSPESNELPSNYLSTPPECVPLPGIEDIQVVLKTGATEALEKIPVHFNTTLKCIQNFVIFSDFEEDIAGFHIHDVLRNVHENVKNTNPDFDLYNRLRNSGRQGLTAGDISTDPNTASGKPSNTGWKLDKWKFLPMINETLQIRDDAKWYVFIEADTYMVWPNLLAWLERFDPRQPYYFGNQMQIGDVVFAHGGSGFVISHAAMHQVAEYHASRVDEWDTFTDNHWAGDCVLGKALLDAGIPLFWSWPMFQGSTPKTFDYFSTGYNKQPWCFPPLAYHHMTSKDIQEMWAFEQGWERKKETKQSILLHNDVFRGLIHPQLRRRKDDWDNLSSDRSEGLSGSLEDCETHCAQDPECVQYSYGTEGCLTSKLAKGGERKLRLVSGWMPERINDAVEKLGSCKKVNWITP